MLEPVANDQAPRVTNWGNIVDSFLDSRSDRRGTTLRDLKTRMRRVLETIAANPKPRACVVNVPDTIPEGKEVLPEGKEVGNYQTPLFATGLD